MKKEMKNDYPLWFILSVIFLILLAWGSEYTLARFLNFSPIEIVYWRFTEVFVFFPIYLITTYTILLKQYKLSRKQKRNAFMFLLTPFFLSIPFIIGFIINEYL
jgi:hypothetical protein